MGPTGTIQKSDGLLNRQRCEMRIDLYSYRLNNHWAGHAGYNIPANFTKFLFCYILIEALTNCVADTLISARKMRQWRAIATSPVTDGPLWFMCVLHTLCDPDASIFTRSFLFAVFDSVPGSVALPLRPSGASQRCCQMLSSDAWLLLSSLGV